MQTTFSIITATYNSEKTLERTIESVLNQSYSNFEYIIIDGNSSDKTLYIIKKYEEEFTKKTLCLSIYLKMIKEYMMLGIRG